MAPLLVHIESNSYKTGFQESHTLKVSLRHLEKCSLRLRNVRRLFSLVDIYLGVLENKVRVHGSLSPERGIPRTLIFAVKNIISPESRIKSQYLSPDPFSPPPGSHLVLEHCTRVTSSTLRAAQRQQLRENGCFYLFRSLG